MTIQAISTRYAGCLFRSRLEARWAVFFDTLKWEWQYEPEGFKVGSECDQSRPYLPDFYLPETETWVEVKGSDEFLDRNLLLLASDYGHGLPGTDRSFGTKRGILVLGPIPRADRYWPVHSIIQHAKGVYVNYAVFGALTLLILPRYGDWFGDSYAGVDYLGPICNPDPLSQETPKPVLAAYAAARSARFEHDNRKVW